MHWFYFLALLSDNLRRRFSLKTMLQNLREMGDWLNTNDEAIYGTQASPFPYLSWGRATLKGQKLYLHVSDWPADGKLNVPFSNKITKVYLLADATTNLKVTAGKEKSTILLPVYAPDKIAFNLKILNPDCLLIHLIHWW